MWFQIITVLTGVHAADDGRGETTGAFDFQGIHTSSTTGFAGSSRAQGSKGFKVQADSADIISAFLDGVRQGCGFRVGSGEAGILNVGAILGDIFAGRLHGKQAADTKATNEIVIRRSSL